MGVPQSTRFLHRFDWSMIRVYEVNIHWQYSMLLRKSLSWYVVHTCEVNNHTT